MNFGISFRWIRHQEAEIHAGLWDERFRRNFAWPDGYASSDKTPLFLLSSSQSNSTLCPSQRRKVVWDGRSREHGDLAINDFLPGALRRCRVNQRRPLFLVFLVGIKLIPPLPRRPFPFLFSVLLAPGARSWWQHRGRSKG